MNIIKLFLKSAEGASIAGLAFALLCSAWSTQARGHDIDTTKAALHAHHLNTLLEKSLTQLDKISSIVQYLGQAINRGSIKVPDRKATIAWLQQSQNFIKAVQKAPVLPLTESQIYRIETAVKLLITQIIGTIRSEFTQLMPLDATSIPMVKRTLVPVKALEIFAEKNNHLLEELKEQANTAGLTTINLVARKLDDINNRYNITETLERLPLIGAIAATALYFTPKLWIRKIPGSQLFGLNWLKNKIGTLTLDPDCPQENKSQKAREEQRVPTGWYDRFLDFVNHEDVQKSATIAGTIVGWTMLKQPLHPYTAQLRQYIRNQWDKLKGFTVPDNSTYTIIEDITLDDERLVGIDSQVEELRNLVRYITDPEIYDRSNSNLEKGILLTGPSRTGKTFAARALCGTINKALSEKGVSTKFGFREIKWGEVIWNAEGIKTIIEKAKKDAPCVLFIDEIHNLPLQTKEGGEVLTQFLTGMSGINSENDSRHQIILLAATNQPELLDQALLQPGRFGTIIRFEKPTYENRKKYFETIFKHNAIDTDDIDIASLVRQTEGCSYGDLETIVKKARFTARTFATSVTQEHLQEQINLHVHRLKKDVPLTSQEKTVISTYLAGPALLYTLLDPERKLELVTIKGRWRKIKEGRFWDAKQREYYKTKVTKYGVLITYNNAETLKLESAQDKEKRCKILLAGALSEALVLGTTGYSYRPKDKQKALSLAKEIVSKGLPTNDLPKTVQQKINQEAYELLERYEQETLKLLTDNKTNLVALSHKLQEKEILMAHEIAHLLNKQ